MTLHGGRHKDGSSSLTVLHCVAQSQSSPLGCSGMRRNPSLGCQWVGNDSNWGVFLHAGPTRIFLCTWGSPTFFHNVACQGPSASDVPTQAAQVPSEVWKSAGAFVAQNIPPSPGFVPITSGHASSSFPNPQVFHQGGHPC